MKQYICLRCGTVSEEHDALCFFPEVHDELPEKPTEWMARLCCPECGSEDLEEAELCDECGEYFLRSELDENDLCPACREKVEAENEKCPPCAGTLEEQVEKKTTVKEIIHDD